MSDDVPIDYDGAVIILDDWIGHAVEVVIGFADGPSHLAGLHGVLALRESDGGRIDGHRLYEVGAAGWFTTRREWNESEQVERPVTYNSDTDELCFEAWDGSLTVSRSSLASPT